MVRLTDLPDMTLDVYRGRKATTQQQQQSSELVSWSAILIYFYSKLLKFGIMSGRRDVRISANGANMRASAYSMYTFLVLTMS